MLLASMIYSTVVQFITYYVIILNANKTILYI